MTKEWLISDTHFGHKNIIKYSNRPFANTEEMDKKLIENWNNTVSKQDTIYHLGDVSFANKEKTIQIIDQLNGRKILIMGNHDFSTGTVKWWKDVFDVVIPYPIILKEHFILSHEPVSYLSGSVPFVNIHGHTHDDSTFTISSNRYSVCVEQIGYKPILFTDVIRYYKEKLEE